MVEAGLSRLHDGDVDPELGKLDRRIAVLVLEGAPRAPPLREPPLGVTHVDDEPALAHGRESRSEVLELCPGHGGDSRTAGPAGAEQDAAYASVLSEPRTDQLTSAQRQALADELSELEGPARAAVVQAIKTAREHGDLSENFEYHAAKNEQGLLEARIRKLRARLDNAVLVDAAELNPDEVGIGSIVEIDDEDGTRMEIEISSVMGAGCVSPDSPLGRALLGRAVGDTVEVDAPRGAWRAEIVSIRRP